MSYSIDGGVIFQASNNFVGVAAGTYEIVVRNANATCPAILSPIVVSAPTAPTLVTTISVNPTGCNLSNGSIQILANGNTTLEYSLDGTVWQSSNMFSNLAGGNYTARVRNIGNLTCSATANAPIVLTPSSSAPTVSNVSKTNPTSCGTSNGTITVTGNSPSGVGGLEYSIDNIHWQNTGLFSNLAAGTYSVYVRNANGTCPTPYSANPVVLNAAGSQSITNVSVTNPSTCGVNDGQIAITVTGPGSPYRYSINGGVTFQNSATFTGLAGGSYNIMVTMSNGDCPVVAPAATLTAPVAPTLVSVIGSNPTTCANNNGTISVTAVNGNAPYQYSLDGNVWQNASTFTGLAAGSYTVRIRNSNASCVVSATTPFVLTAPASPTIISAATTNPTACGIANGTITITATPSTDRKSVV